VNRADAIKLCRYVHAATPAQKLDEYTPQAWADILEDLPCGFDEARGAVVAIKRRQVFVDCSDIIAEVRAVRDARIRLHPPPPPPPELIDDPAAYGEYLRESTRAAADGTSGRQAITGPRRELEGR
jgi:hypothetical protein